VLVTVIVIGLVSLWAYVLYLAFGPGRADSPDKLDDPAFAIQAQERCDAALDIVAELQPASEAPDAAARADTLASANEALADMLDELQEIVPPGEDGEIVEEWLADWHVYLGDREAYAEVLLTDPEARLLVSPKGGSQITDYIDQFSKDNAMPACSTPADAA
jgi:hypothetical protein